MTAILKSKMAVLDILILCIFLKNITGKFFNCEVEINVLNPKVAKNHLRINSVDMENIICCLSITYLVI